MGIIIMNTITNLQRENKVLKEQQAESVRLLKQCSTQVGMMLGESILEHVAAMEGTHFNSKEYHYEKPVGEQ